MLFFLTFIAGIKIFHDFLKSQYSEENLLFWLAVERLKKEKEPAALKKMAQGIYRDYLSSESPKEVSLSLGNRNIRLWQVLRFCNDAYALWSFSDIRKFTPKPRFHLIVFQILLCCCTMANQTCSKNHLTYLWNIIGILQTEWLYCCYMSLCVLWNVL